LTPYLVLAFCSPAIEKLLIFNEFFDMATEKAEKAVTGARTAESDPNYMLLYYITQYTNEGTIDWDKITELMGAPSSAAL
jgi:hypothetical protein